MARERVLVTGASSGIGAATVRALSEAGFPVAAVARRADRLEALAAETGALVRAVDLTDPGQIDSMRDWLADAGGIGGLVNNAGGALGSDSVEEGSAEDWRWMYEINVIAVKNVVASLLPLLRDGARRQGHADILTVTSTAGYFPYEGGGGYNAAKFAARALVGVLRLELAGEPIRVLEVAPGMVRTDEFALVRYHGDAQKAAAVYEGVEEPLTAEDVASSIAHMLTLPGHISTDLAVLKPVAQAAVHKVVRRPLQPRA